MGSSSNPRFSLLLFYWNLGHLSPGGNTDCTTSGGYLGESSSRLVATSSHQRICYLRREFGDWSHCHFCFDSAKQERSAGTWKAEMAETSMGLCREGEARS